MLVEQEQAEHDPEEHLGRGLFEVSEEEEEEEEIESESGNGNSGFSITVTADPAVLDDSDDSALEGTDAIADSAVSADGGGAEADGAQSEKRLF